LTLYGAFIKLEAIWILADIFNGLMALPNLIALLALSAVGIYVIVSGSCLSIPSQGEQELIYESFKASNIF